jgi:hypothetical protein
MAQVMPKWESRVWKVEQGHVHPLDNANCFVNFEFPRLELATAQVTNSKQLVLTKPIPLHSQRLPSLERRGGAMTAGVLEVGMAVQEERRHPEEKKVQFPPPKKWVLEARWNFFFVLGRGCPKKKPPSKCGVIKGMTPQQRFAKVKEREFCKLRFRHLDTKQCSAVEKVPNCDIDRCALPNHPLLHETRSQAGR